MSTNIRKGAATAYRPLTIGASVAAALIALPMVLPPRAVGTVIQMQIAALFALAFNILWQQTRLLSFGHAAFFGIGMFATIHLMRMSGSDALLPLPLLPIGGVLAGLLLGVLAGFFATARSGTYFAMITLAFAELIHQLAPQWEGVFGGESGLSAMRKPWAGLSFGSDVEVYYLVLAWTLVAVSAMHFFTRTPLGRLAFALGDNELRVSFLGYNARLAKTLVFAISAMFAGLAGGLVAIANENVDHTIFRASMSGQVVIHTFVGGAGLFLGPVIGAAGLTLAGSLASDITRLWVLYQGLLFVAVVMFIPQGIVGIVAEYASRGRFRQLSENARSIIVGTAGICAVAGGLVFVAELLMALVANPFALQTRDGSGSVRLWGANWQKDALLTWLPPLGAIGCGLMMVRSATRWTDQDKSKGHKKAGVA